MSWFKFRNLSVIVDCVTKSLIHEIALNLNLKHCTVSVAIVVIVVFVVIVEIVVIEVIAVIVVIVVIVVILVIIVLKSYVR